MDTQIEFIESIRKLAKGTAAQDAVSAHVLDCLVRWAGPPPWLGTPTKAELELWFADSTVSVFSIVWPPHLITEPHNHCMWATVAVYQGRENNLYWERSDDSIQVVGGESAKAGDVIDLPENAIHPVHNPVGDYTGAIHVYGGDFLNAPRSEWDPLSLSERPRDMDRAVQAFTQLDKS
jgi:predicted metal-dependent enzyme (double-stranded beta helix superfamily)